jgi:predicted transcriptional regulator
MNGATDLTPLQVQHVEAFLNLFSDVEAALKKRLDRKSNDRTGVAKMIDDYAEINPLWSISANELRNLADIRNLLTHQRSYAGGYPVAVSPRSVASLREILHQLREPVPVSKRYRRPVLTVSPDETLARILRLAVENDFSQFPVEKNHQFKGLITENEIVRWLGRRSSSGYHEFDFSKVTANDVLHDSSTNSLAFKIFSFARLDAAELEVMSRFTNQPTLEVVLLTSTGNNRTRCEGIITQWDAARHARKATGHPKAHDPRVG